MESCVFARLARLWGRENSAKYGEVWGGGQSEMSWEKNARRNREWFAGQRQ